MLALTSLRQKPALLQGTECYVEDNSPEERDNKEVSDLLEARACYR